MSEAIISDASIPSTTYVLGTRQSKLALVQTSIVQASLADSHPSHHAFAISGMLTAGDRDKVQPLYLMGGKALWTKDLEVALLSGAVDLVVHSLKDMPTVLPEGCELGAILEREDPRDALVVKAGLDWKGLEEMPKGSVVGTSSVRRLAQLKRRYPQLEFQDVRGNIDTRLSKLDDPSSAYTAIILAAAGLVRLQLSHRITTFLEPPAVFHAVGQGAIGVEIRTPGWNIPVSEEFPEETEAVKVVRKERAEKVKTMVAGLEHWPTAWRCEAERALLRTLEGGCSVPVGVNTTIVPTSPTNATLKLIGVVTSLDGQREVQVIVSEVVGSKAEAAALGVRVAEELKKKGADAILQEIEKFKTTPAEAGKTIVRE